MELARELVRDEWMRKSLERRGLLEATIRVAADHEGVLWAVLRAYTKQRHFYLRLPGLPKETRFMLETVEAIVDYLVGEANRFPDVPKTDRPWEVCPGVIQLPTVPASERSSE